MARFALSAGRELVGCAVYSNYWACPAGSLRGLDRTARNRTARAGPIACPWTELPATGPPKAPARVVPLLELDERPADELLDELPH
jgi:hypothetical protein